ncbi:hypothetical protein D3C84_913650 [compost metagenome]
MGGDVIERPALGVIGAEITIALDQVKVDLRILAANAVQQGALDRAEAHFHAYVTRPAGQLLQAVQRQAVAGQRRHALQMQTTERPVQGALL